MDKSITILVVDDYHHSRIIVRTILKRLGFENIVEVEDGYNAIKALQEQKFGLIISDWSMPHIDGLELLKKIRTGEAGQENKGIPFLMLTAKVQREAVAKAIDAGVTDYIGKPFTEEIIKQKLEKILDLSD